MSFLSLSFYYVFSANVLTGWGLIRQSQDSDRQTGKGIKRKAFFSPLIFMFITLPVTLLDTLVTRYLLIPLKMEALGALSFALFLFGAYAIVLALIRAIGKPLASLSWGESGSVPLSLALFAAAKATSTYSSELLPAAIASLTAAFGLIAATTFLDDIMERLSLEPVAPAMHGAPLRLVSAGLIALAFSGVDSALLSRMNL